jgi:hypothetical protein
MNAWRVIAVALAVALIVVLYLDRRHSHVSVFVDNPKCGPLVLHKVSDFAHRHNSAWLVVRAGEKNQRLVRFGPLDSVLVSGIAITPGGNVMLPSNPDTTIDLDGIFVAVCESDHIAVVAGP